METQTINISEIASHPTMRMDAEYWDKKKNLQIGTRVLVAHNLEGNMDEPFIGLQGIIIRFKNKGLLIIRSLYRQCKAKPLTCRIIRKLRLCRYKWRYSK